MINRVVDLVNELHEIATNQKFVIAIESYRGAKEVHVPFTDDFFKFFKQYDIQPRENDKYPFEAFVEIDGVKFFSLLTQKEYEEYVEKTV